MKYLITVALFSLFSVSAFAATSLSVTLSGTSTSKKMAGTTAELSVTAGVVVLQTCIAQGECSVFVIPELNPVDMGMNLASGDVYTKYSLTKDIILVSEGRQNNYQYYLYFNYDEQAGTSKGVISLLPKAKLNL